VPWTSQVGAITGPDRARAAEPARGQLLNVVSAGSTDRSAAPASIPRRRSPIGSRPTGPCSSRSRATASSRSRGRTHEGVHAARAGGSARGRDRAARGARGGARRVQGTGARADTKRFESIGGPMAESREGGGALRRWADPKGNHAGLSASGEPALPPIPPISRRGRDPRGRAQAVFLRARLRGLARHRAKLRASWTLPATTTQGKKVAVRFRDDELLCGYTLSFSPDRPASS
jgi:hypothetical protein